MNRRIMTLTLGGLIVLLAVMTPSSEILQILSTRPGDRFTELLLGITLFKYSLAAFGGFLILLGRLPIWEVRAGKPSTETPYHFLSWVMLAIILCIAAMLRLHALDSGLWLDEIFTYVNYARLPFGEIVSTYRDQNQHFLYSLLAHASIVIFGDSGWSLRLPAALFGTASIWALYLFAREVTNEREALLTAVLLTFSYHHVWFSQNARGYIGLLFWTLLSSWFFVRALRTQQPRLWLFYAMTASLGVYTNTGMLFVVAAQFIHYLWELLARQKENWADRWSGLFLGFCMAGILTFLLHALVLPQMLTSVEVSTVPAWKQPFWAVVELMKAIQIDFAGAIAAVAALLLFGIGLWSYARTEPLVVELLIVPAMTCAAVVIGIGFHVWPRLFFFAFGFAALIVIRGATQLGQKGSQLFLKMSSTNALRTGTIFAVGLILVSAVSVPRAYAPKQDFLAALKFIDANKKPGDTIAMVGLVSFGYKNFYRRDWQEVETVDELDSIRSHAKHTWLLYSFPTHVAAVYPEIMGEIKRDFQIVKKFPGTIGDGSIFVSRSNRAWSQAVQ